MPKCTQCGKDYDEKEVERIYGGNITMYGCYTPQCYTKKLTGEAPQNSIHTL